tara:strand:+ start:300 stop:608 length:309 start_codon:yes stop_codon:yes gene_type:complete
MDRSECFREFIGELSRRLADESDYETELAPKLQELLNMTGWIVGEAWENGLGGIFKGKYALMLLTDKGWVADGIYSKEDAQYYLEERKEEQPNINIKIERVK